MRLLGRLLGRDAERRDPVPERDPDDRLLKPGPDLRMIGIESEALTQLAMAMQRGQLGEVTSTCELAGDELRIVFAQGAFVVRAERLSMSWEDVRRG
jgi:hypothetical protein